MNCSLYQCPIHKALIEVPSLLEAKWVLWDFRFSHYLFIETILMPSFHLIRIPKAMHIKALKQHLNFLNNLINHTNNAKPGKRTNNGYWGIGRGAGGAIGSMPIKTKKCSHWIIRNWTRHVDSDLSAAQAAVVLVLLLVDNDCFKMLLFILFSLEKSLCFLPLEAALGCSVKSDMKTLWTVNCCSENFCSEWCFCFSPANPCHLGRRL